MGSKEALRPITPNWESLISTFLDDGAFQAVPVPLGAIYFLDERQEENSAPRVAPLGGQEALMTLVANTYGTTLLDPQMRAREFSVLGRLVKKVPLRRVVPHASPERVWQLCDVILEDVEYVRLSSLTATAQSQADHE